MSCDYLNISLSQEVVDWTVQTKVPFYLWLGDVSKLKMMSAH